MLDYLLAFSLCADAYMFFWRGVISFGQVLPPHTQIYTNTQCMDLSAHWQHWQSAQVLIYCSLLSNTTKCLLFHLKKNTYSYTNTHIHKKTQTHTLPYSSSSFPSLWIGLQLEWYWCNKKWQLLWTVWTRCDPLGSVLIKSPTTDY